MVLSGAVGPSAKVNGTYYLTAETLNGKYVYGKEGDADTWLFYGTSKSWFVSGTVNKEANKCAGYACTEAGLFHPAAAKAWQVGMGGTKWEAQPVKATIMVSDCVSPVCFCLRVSPGGG